MKKVKLLLWENHAIAGGRRRDVWVAGRLQGFFEASLGNLLHAAVSETDVTLTSVLIASPVEVHSRVAGERARISCTIDAGRAGADVAVAGQEHAWNRVAGIDTVEIAKRIVLVTTEGFVTERKVVRREGARLEIDRWT